MLQHLIGEKAEDIQENVPEVKEGLFNLFDQPPQEAPQAEDKKVFKVDDFLEEEKKEDKGSRVIPYD
jgi:hypothetical protein